MRRLLWEMRCVSINRLDVCWPIPYTPFNIGTRKRKGVTIDYFRVWLNTLGSSRISVMLI